MANTDKPISSQMHNLLMSAKDTHIARIEEELLALRRQYRQTHKGWTVILFVTEDYETNFYILEGNYFRYIDCYLNWVPDNVNEQNELARQDELRKIVAKFPTPITAADAVLFIRRGAKLVRCGEVTPLEESELGYE